MYPHDLFDADILLTSHDGEVQQVQDAIATAAAGEQSEKTAGRSLSTHAALWHQATSLLEIARCLSCWPPVCDKLQQHSLNALFSQSSSLNAVLGKPSFVFAP